MEMNRTEFAAVNGLSCDVLDARGRLLITPNPVTVDGQRNVPADLLPGESLEAFLRRHVPGIESGAWTVMIGGAAVPRAMWKHTRPKHGQLIACRASVGKQVLQIVAVAVLAYFTMGAGAAWIGATFGVGAGAAAAIGAGIFAAGSMLINKVLGPKVSKPGEAAAARQVYSLSDQRNSARAYESLPVLWGEMRVTPDLASQPYTWFDGDNQYLSTILLGGINVHSAADLAIGDTPITSFSEVELFYSGFAGMDSQEMPLYSNADSIAGGELENDGAWVTRTSSVGSIALQVDLEGQLYDMDNKGGVLANNVPLFIETAPVGTQAWESALTTTLSNSTLDVVRRTFTLTVSPGQHEVRLRLGKPTYDEGGGKDACKFIWNVLKSIQPDTTDYSGWGRIGIKIKATGQISGSLDTLRATYRSRPLPVWNGNGWTNATTRAEGLSNPGAILLQTLRGVYANGLLQFGFGMADEQIDIEGLKAFMLHCAARGYTYDRWVTGQVSLGAFCQEVALAGMGEFTWTDGSRPSAVFVSSGQPMSGVVNMANMLQGSFSVAYNLANAADGVEYQYLDRERNWETQTLRVAAPGVTTMLNPARITGEGVTSEAHAAVLARYHLAQSLYQYKTIDFGADIEHLAYRRLSVLSVSHDLTQWGFGGRVLQAQRVGGKVVLQLDEPVPPLAQAYVGLRVPGARDYRVFQVEALAAQTDHITLAGAWPAGVAFPGESLDNPAHDTLWCYDFKATPGYRVRVVGMQPEADLKGAQVSCVPEGPEFWDYVLNGNYTPAPNQSSLPQLGRPEVSNLRITEKVNVQGDTEWYSLSLVWDVEGDYDHAQVWAGRDGSELRMVDGNALGSRSEFRIDGAGEWLIEVRPFNASGLAGQSATVLYITSMTQMPPRNVDDFVVQTVAGGLRRFAWQYTGDRPAAFAGVQIRYAPGDVPLSVASWDGMQPLGEADDVYGAQFETTRPEAGLWTFGCRAINTAGQLANGVARFVANLDDSFEQVQQPDLTPPPDVTGLAATAMFTAVLVEWDAVAYEQGHGHARTVIYAAQGEAATFAQATQVAEAYNGPVSFASEPDIVWKVWAKNQTSDGVLSVYPAGPVQVRTAEDVDKVLDALNGKIDQDQLVQHLAGRIDLIDGTGVGSVNARVADEAQMRAAAVANVAQQLGTSVQALEQAITAGDTASAERVESIIATNYSRPNLVPSWPAWELGGGMLVQNAEWGQALYSRGDGTRVAISPHIAIAGGVGYTLTCDSLRFATGGSCYLDLIFYDGAGVQLLDSEQVHRTDAHDFREDDANRVSNSLHVVAPAAARTCRVRAVQNAGVGVTAIGWRQVKLERGSLPATRYTEEAQGLYALAAIADERGARVAADAAEVFERSALSAQLRGEYVGNDLGGITSGLLAQERNARVTGDNALSYQMSMLSAGVGEQFDSAKIWFFDTDGDAEGWSGRGTLAVSSGFMRPPNATGFSNITSPAGLAVESSKFRQIKVRLRKIGSPSWVGRAWWREVGSTGFDSSRAISVPAPVYDLNGIALVTWNMPWSGVIEAINFDLFQEQTSAGSVEVDWVAIGRPSPGASQASVMDEAEARASADAAGVTARQQLAVSLTGVPNPEGATLDQLTSGLLVQERSARVAADSAETTERQQLAANLQQGLTSVNAALAEERVVRAQADSAQSTARQQLEAVVAIRGNFAPDVQTWARPAQWAYATDGWGPRLQSTAVAASGSVDSPVFDIAPGVVYTVSGDSLFMEMSAGSLRGHVGFNLAFFDAANKLISFGALKLTGENHDYSDAIGDIQRHAVETLTPANAVKALVRFTWSSASGYRAIGFRRVKVERGGLPATQYSMEGDAGSLRASLQQEASVRADQTGTLFGRYSVKIDLNGYMTGYGLLAESNNGVNTSTFAVRADRFVIGDTSNNAVRPFVVEAGRVYIDSAVIRDATIKNAMIENGTIQSAKMVSIEASKLTSGYIGVGNFIASTGYQAGLNGWAIWGNGNAEFSNITVRGTVYATSGQIAAWRINSDQLLSGAFTGFAWPASGVGVCIAHGGILLGNLNNGQYLHLTREGNLYAPGLRIESGNAWFSGRLTAQAVSAVDTINIAGNAVTVPMAISGGAYAGAGISVWRVINSGLIPMTQSGYVTGLLVAVQNHIGNSNNWRMRMEIWQGSLIGAIELGGQALTVSPTISLTRAVAAGSVEVVVKWWGGDVNCRIESSELLILGVKR